MAKHPGGRPSKYDPKYCQEIVEFCDIPAFKTIQIVTTGKNDYEKVEEKEVANPPPFITAFARKIGVSMDTLNEWTRVHPEFSDAFKKAEQIRNEIIITNGIKGLYNPAFAIFTMKNVTDWRDQSPAPTVIHNHFTNVLQQIRAMDENKPQEIKPRASVLEALRD